MFQGHFNLNMSKSLLMTSQLQNLLLIHTSLHKDPGIVPWHLSASWTAYRFHGQSGSTYCAARRERPLESAGTPLFLNHYAQGQSASLPVYCYVRSRTSLLVSCFHLGFLFPLTLS